MLRDGKLSVLIVEDETIVAMMVEDFVVELGHEVVAIEGRLERALTLAQSAQVDFAILDVNLNGQLTYPIAEALTARHVPFVFATGYGSQGLSDAWRHVPVLQKPFQLEALKRAIVRSPREA